MWVPTPPESPISLGGGVPLPTRTPSPVSLTSISPPPISPSAVPASSSAIPVISPVTSHSASPFVSPFTSPVASPYSPPRHPPPASPPPIHCPRPISIQQPLGHIEAAIETHENTTRSLLATSNYGEEKSHIKKKPSTLILVISAIVAAVIVLLALGLGLGLGLGNKEGPRSALAAIPGAKPDATPVSRKHLSSPEASLEART